MKTAVFICPGRGTYNRNELGYLSQHFPDKTLLAQFDAIRAGRNEETILDLDGAQSFSLSRHARGDNASGLIFAATLGDFLSVNREQIEIVAVTGNSMGWYTALACAGAVTPTAGFELTDTMGALMHRHSIGGQLVYPFLGDDWQADGERKGELLSIIAEIDTRPDATLALSIDLGGMLVVAGNEKGLAAFEAAVPRIQDRFPMRLPGHAAFHTPLQEPVAAEARSRIGPDGFGQPQCPIIDGRGHIWWPHAVDRHALWDYTLGHQVTQPYDFTRAMTVAAREFAPDLFIIGGPGTTLGSAVIQSLILANWRGMTSKADFEKHQTDNQLVAAMGNDEQRTFATNGERT